MAERQKFDVRTLVDGHTALRNFLASQRASAVPNEMLIAFSRIDRQLRVVAELTNQRKAAFAQEFGVEVSPDGSRYVMSLEAEDGPENFAKFQMAVNDWMDTPYPIEFEPVSWADAVAAMPDLSALHYAMMPFAFRM